ncbi:MAG TPA: DUF3108 domain-containing protein [Hyphomicrobiaceae bacterium]|nr:DUF3108 domain-containing protein [Hyphomicrobiaceae bacterium]
MVVVGLRFDGRCPDRARRWDRLATAAFVGGLIFAGPGLLAGICGAEAADRWPGEVVAEYQVRFSGFKVGRLVFRSKVETATYALQADGKMSALFGAYKWSGTARSEGGALDARPVPAAYSLDYRANRKRGSVRMSLGDARVKKVSVTPPRSGVSVPVEPKHLAGVVDPLSAVMALSRGGASGNPCRQRLAIFDGKQRFDLDLSLAGRERIAERGNSGQPSMGYVCRVRYRPIAGYLNNKTTAFMRRHSGIRIVLRAVSGAGIHVPQEIRLPTIAGDAVIRLKRVTITTAGKQRIALVN